MTNVYTPNHFVPLQATVDPRRISIQNRLAFEIEKESEHLTCDDVTPTEVLFCENRSVALMFA